MPPQTTALPYRPRLVTTPPRTPVGTAATLPRQPAPVPAHARATALPARPDHRPTAQTPPRSGVWIDRTAWLATVDGRALQLTYLEFEVLDFFVHHPGQAHSRQALLSSVWGHQADDATSPDVRTVDVLVTRLRRKLGPEHRYRIETVRRVGYRYRPLDPTVAS
ncbi:winged helix-turn-helix domain-containing protein [Frankia sp. AiPs1]|uniref:winged helix-turn-helix domain-containing protein n=1 Tax=Frankia sp. AiPs1 TaxID=573493 RepID=UPI002042CC91|nr:winged helix-turn-helix domain-containing protein [Frankia sp. AiPs1]MCM3924720.1 winged helix-turn-helix domain-containing protein [Frankia sp. AiPs1]